MIKKPILCCLLAGIAFFALAYENNMPNLVVPSNIGAGQLELDILHRLFDPVNVANPDGFFAGGANVNLGLRYMILNELEADAGYTFSANEIKAGLAYNLSFPDIAFRARADASYVNYKDFRFTDRINDVFPLVSLQFGPLFNFLILNANVGYDPYNLNLGCGAGLDFVLPFGMHVMAECVFPVLYQGIHGNSGSAVFISAAYKIEVGGHHFIFTIANSPVIDTRRLMLGVQAYDRWYFGFTIQRLFQIVD